MNARLDTDPHERVSARRAGRTPLVAVLLALLVVCGLAAAAAPAGAAAKPGKPTAKAPTGTSSTVKPNFKWSKAAGATTYEVRVYNGSKQLLKHTGITKVSWKSSKALPENVSLTWKVRARNAAGSGAWSKSLKFMVGLAIGGAYQGGKIAYILQSGDPGYVVGQTHGLIAATADRATGIRWYNGAYVATGATATALGTGLANTNMIIAVQGATATSYAAGWARAYKGGGYTDWYLPSKDELNKLYQHQAAIGGFGPNYYWSSSESDADFAWTQAFDLSSQNPFNKNGASYVRAVRAF